jgi:hypothetical protein
MDSEEFAERPTMVKQAYRDALTLEHQMKKSWTDALADK